MYVNLLGKCIHLVDVIHKTWHSRDIPCVDKIVIIIYFPEKRSIEILTNLWGVKGHIRSGREMLSSRDSEEKLFKNIFLPQGWYNWWCIFYRSLMDEIFLNCFLHILSLLWAFPAPDRIRQVRKHTPSLFLLHLNSHLLKQLMLKAFIFKEFIYDWVIQVN